MDHMEHIGLINLTNVYLNKARNDDDNAITLLLNSLELCEDSYTYEKLAIEYEYHDFDDDVVYCYEKAIEMRPESTRLLYNFANFWKDQSDVNKMLKYLKLGASKDDLSCIISLAAYYYDYGSRIEWLKYCLQNDCYNKDYDEFEGQLHSEKLYDILHDYILNKIYEIYDLLQGKIAPMLLKPCIEESKKYVAEHLTKMRNNPSICTLDNKVRLFTRLKNVHECIICYEEKLNICLDCGHELCVDCYKKTYSLNQNCHYCRF